MTILVWVELGREAISHAIERGASVALPLGAVEQHGPHLPTGTDVMMAEHIVQRAARTSRSPVLVLPALPFGLSHYHQRWGGTISLSAETLSRLLADTAASVAAAGARRLFVVNGHGGNRGICTTLSLDASSPEFGVYAFSYWDLVPEIARELFVADRGSLGHAGQAEASIVASVRPDLVGSLATVQHEPIGPPFGLTAIERLGDSGVSGNPEAARAELGAKFVDAVVQHLAALFDGETAGQP